MRTAPGAHRPSEPPERFAEAGILDSFQKRVRRRFGLEDLRPGFLPGRHGPVLQEQLLDGAVSEEGVDSFENLRLDVLEFDRERGFHANVEPRAALRRRDEFLRDRFFRDFLADDRGPVGRETGLDEPALPQGDRGDRGQADGDAQQAARPAPLVVMSFPGHAGMLFSGS